MLLRVLRDEPFFETQRIGGAESVKEMSIWFSLIPSSLRFKKGTRRSGWPSNAGEIPRKLFCSLRGLPEWRGVKAREGIEPCGVELFFVL